MFNSRVPNPGQVILIIAVMTACVFFTRLIPFVFFGGKRGMNPFIKKLSDILPLSMMAVLVVYCDDIRAFAKCGYCRFGRRRMRYSPLETKYASFHCAGDSGLYDRNTANIKKIGQIARFFLCSCFFKFVFDFFTRLFGK